MKCLSLLPSFLQATPSENSVAVNDDDNDDDDDDDNNNNNNNNNTWNITHNTESTAV